MANQSCPCGSGLPFGQCCGPFLDGTRVPPTAEALMRSRYSAYVRQNENYLLQSWHTSTRPAKLDLSENAPDSWLGLKIVRTEAGSANDHNGIVEFIARYKLNGKAYRLHEVSHFIKENARWYYL